ncbi:MAG: hypothetical protein M1491_07055, partial [Deltaproteobacteria bacterium]|nr:hypothetical protein [Deltaproteobacteria bacterium]
MWDKEKYERKTIRLKGWDYSNAGAYFVTICAYKKRCIFENIIVASIIKEQWEELPKKFNCIDLDEFVIMPNHLHCILWIKSVNIGRGNHVANSGRGNPCGYPLAGASPAPTLGNVDDGPLAGASLAPTLGNVDDGPLAGASPAPTLGNVDDGPLAGASPAP